MRDNDSDLRKFWRLQRVGWGLMALFIAVGVSGLMGNGPLAKKRAANDGLEVEYSRFLRMTAGSYIVITADPRGADAVELTISGDYVRQCEIRHETPQAASATSSPGGITLAYRARADGPVRAYLDIRPREGTFGIVRGRVSTAYAVVEFWQLVWP